MLNFLQRTLSSEFVGGIIGWLVALLLVCWALGPVELMADEDDPLPAPMKEIRFAATEGLYPNVSRKDGRMALELLMQKTIVKRSYPYSVKLIFIDPVHDLPSAIKSGGYHFVTLSSIDYYRYRDALYLKPIMTPTKINTPTEQLLLLVEPEQALKTIRKKEERSLIIESGFSGDLSKIWLDHLLMDGGFGISDQFFTKIRRVSKPGRAILPVFFKQADACIVSRHALEVIQELNPQIGRKVKALHKSKGLIRLMICATDKPTDEDIDILIRESSQMEHNPETLQAMTILQMKRFVPIHPEDLKATENLLLRHHKIAQIRSPD